MIIESFEIENWSCIKKVSVTGLPATGVVVLHGQNRTGKSSIVQALRACLMDYSATTTALKSYYPRRTGEKPLVSVTFRSGDNTFRIKKQFGTNKSELASKTLAGGWKVEVTAAGEAHDRTCTLAGGKDSTKGLHQLLWLTQAEFRLPDPRKFDANVQAQLRGILGVLQTPLDDRFVERVKKRWNTWFSGQRKPGQIPKIKESCKLADTLKNLEGLRKELQESETKFSEVERLLGQAAKLEEEEIELGRQLGDRMAELQNVEEEHRRSRERVQARQQAEKEYQVANREKADALAEQQQRSESLRRLQKDEGSIEPAQREAETIGANLRKLEGKRDQQRNHLGAQRNDRRLLQERANSVAAKLQSLALAQRLVSAQQDYGRAKGIAEEIDSIEQYLSDNPAPDEETLKRLKTNQRRRSELAAEQGAASMNLALLPEKANSEAHIAVDGKASLPLPDSQSPSVFSVRRKAELSIQGWGRAELTRGTGSVDLDQIEQDLRSCDQEFANTVTPLGIAASDPEAFEKILKRVSEHAIHKQELLNKKKELRQMAPEGIAKLHEKIRELQTKCEDITKTEQTVAEPLPADESALNKLAVSLKEKIEAKDRDIKILETDIERMETELTTQRQEEIQAKECLATCNAKAQKSREELERLRSEEVISKRVEDANRGLTETESHLKQTELTKEELTIGDRLEAAQQAVAALEKQIGENTKQYHEIKGRLIESEGLHSQRSSLAARVEELTQLKEQESLDKDAVDRLYTLFEECREKQLGTLMRPIQDRVLGWMRLLDIGDYREMRFNDTFLPEKLMTHDGASEFTIDEESTGAQEQIGILVRLALGSNLSSASDPAVAILDDPLTHCDTGRHNRMRVILRRAAEGDLSITPPAGPLQIIIFTCHPEWFRDEKAFVINLEDSQVMTRWPD